MFVCHEFNARFIPGLLSTIECIARNMSRLQYHDLLLLARILIIGIRIPKHLGEGTKLIYLFHILPGTSLHWHHAG